MVNEVRKAVLIAAVLLLSACGAKQAEAPAAATATAVVQAAQATQAAGAGAGVLPVSNRSVPAGEQPTKAEEYLMKQGVTISQAFISRSSLKAIVADNGTERRLFYVSPDGNSLISGMVFDLQGQNITNEDMARFNVRDVGGSQALSQDQLGDLWQRAGELRYIAEGEGRPVYVVFDPNCPYCHQLWQSLRQVAAAGQVQIRWIPVAILDESSKNLAAALYQTRSPLTALNELGVSSLVGAPVVEKATADILAHNLLLLRDTGLTGVPTVLWKDGDQVRVHGEVPQGQQFAAIFR